VDSSRGRHLETFWHDVHATVTMAEGGELTLKLVSKGPHAHWCKMRVSGPKNALKM
jgi:hypothetical protein